MKPNHAGLSQERRKISARAENGRILTADFRATHEPP
jgi:hypothetical protein